MQNLSIPLFRQFVVLLTFIVEWVQLLMFLLDPVWGWNINFRNVFWKWLARFQASWDAIPSLVGTAHACCTGWCKTHAATLPAAKPDGSGSFSMSPRSPPQRPSAQLENAVTGLSYEVRPGHNTAGALMRVGALSCCACLPAASNELAFFRPMAVVAAQLCSPPLPALLMT